MWLKALLGSVFGLGFVACLIIGLAIYIHAPAVSPFEVPATNPLPSAAEPELKVKTPDINSDLNVPKDAVLPPKEFEQTFLVPRVEGERPGFKTSVDDAVQSFLANSEPIEKHIEYRDWQSEDMDSQSQLEIVTPIDYLNFFASRDIGALDLQFGSTNKTGARPLRIVELVRKKDLSNAKLPFSSAEFFVDLTGDSDEFTLLNIEGEEKSEIPSFRSGSNGELVLRAGPRLVEILGSQIGDEAILMPAHDGSIYPTLKLENARNLRLIRERFEDQAAGGDQATSVDPTLQWLDSSGASKKNLAEFLSGLREHFDLPALELAATPQASPQPSPGENKAPDLGAAFLETMNELKGSARSDAQEVGEILAPWSPATPVSQLRDDLRSELAKRRGDSMERSKKQAEKILGDHFAGGNALLPAGDYILGLRQEGRFYPAMDITITYPPENENEKRLRRDGSSQGLQTQ